jgi:hypothetical protein
MNQTTKASIVAVQADTMNFLSSRLSEQVCA